MTIDIPGSIAQIERLVQGKSERVKRVEARDRVYLIDQQDGDVTEVLPRLEDIDSRPPATTRVRDLASLARWARSCKGQEPTLIVSTESTAGIPEPILVAEVETMKVIHPPGQVVVGARKMTTSVWPQIAPPFKKRVECFMPFFDAYLPPSDDAWMTYVDFIAWVDLIMPFLDDDLAKIIQMGLESFEAKQEDSTAVAIRNAGANLNIVSKGEKRSTLDGKFPKVIEADIPYGDPTFRTRVKFTVTMKLEDDEIVVKVAHHPEPATSAWITFAQTLLSADLPEGWTVLIGD